MKMYAYYLTKDKDLLNINLDKGEDFFKRKNSKVCYLQIHNLVFLVQLKSLHDTYNKSHIYTE